MAIPMLSKQHENTVPENPNARRLASRRNAILIITALFSFSLFQWSIPHFSFPQVVQDGHIPSVTAPFDYETVRL